jgi:hypothetical protein
VLQLSETFETLRTRQIESKEYGKVPRMMQDPLGRAQSPAPQDAAEAAGRDGWIRHGEFSFVTSRLHRNSSHLQVT